MSLYDTYKKEQASRSKGTTASTTPKAGDVPVKEPAGSAFERFKTSRQATNKGVLESDLEDKTPVSDPAMEARRLAEESTTVKQGKFDRLKGFVKTAGSATKSAIANNSLVKDLRNVWSEGIKNISTIKKEELPETIKETAKGVGGALKGIGLSAYDLLTKQAPKAVSTMIAMSAESDRRQIFVPTFGLVSFKDPAFLEKKKAQVADWANGVTRELDRQQQERLKSLGINEDSSIVDPKNFGYQLGSGISSMALAIGLTYATKNPVIAAGTLGWLEGSDTYNQSKVKIAQEHPDWDKDRIEDRARVVAGVDTVGIAVLEKFGIDALFRSFAGGRLYKASINSITESVQETSQTIWSNLVARYGYDKSREVFEKAGETFLVTLPIGFLGGGALGGGGDTQILGDEEREKVTGEVAKNAGITPEEAQEVIDVMLPELQKEAEQSKNIIEKQEEAMQAIAPDIISAVNKEGKDVVAQEIVDDADIPVDSREEADALIDDVLAQFGGEDDEVLSNIQRAEEAVLGSQKAETEQVDDEVVQEDDEDQVAEEAIPSEVERILETLNDDPAVENDWQENYADRFSQLTGEVGRANEELKKVKKSKDPEKYAELRKTVTQKNKELARMENEFLRKYRDVAEQQKEKMIQESVEEIEGDVRRERTDAFIESYRKSHAEQSEAGFESYAESNIQDSEYMRRNKPEFEGVDRDEAISRYKEIYPDKKTKNKRSRKEDDEESTSVDDLTTPEGVAKDFIRAYVERGDTIKMLKDGGMGAYNDKYGVQIGGYLVPGEKHYSSDNILVQRMNGETVNKVISLKKTFDEIKAEKTKVTQEEKVKKAVSKEAKTIKQVAEETGIKEPNIRRILGQGAKGGVFERIDKGVYILSNGKEDIAFIHTADAVEALPRLAKGGLKVDMVFLDIPYDTPAVKGGNRGVQYDLISVADFRKVMQAVSDIVRTNETPVYSMFSQAPSGLRKMTQYNEVIEEVGFKVVARGNWQKMFNNGKPVTNVRGKVALPEGILLLNKKGEFIEKDEERNLDFETRRPKGYSTEKPVELLNSLILQGTKAGATILDPFAGSGVTGAEAVRAGRKAVLIEKDPEVAEKITKPRVQKALAEMTVDEILEEEDDSPRESVSLADKPLFSRFLATMPTADIESASSNLLTAEEVEASQIFLAQGRITDDIKPLLESARKKYLDFVAQKPKFERDLSTDILEELGDRVTVSRQFIVDLTKRAGVKKAEINVINEALAEMPEGKDVNVELFRAKVGAKLLPIDIVSIQESEIPPAYDHVVLPREVRGEVTEYDEHIFRSPIPVSAGQVHFSSYDSSVSGRYFAHARIEDLPTESIRRILEIQSDLFQRGRLTEEATAFGAMEGDDSILKIAKRTGQTTEEVVGRLTETAREKVKPLEPYRNTWHERVIREELVRASEDGKKVLLFPAGDTAMLVEGLGNREQRWLLMGENNIPSARLAPKLLKVGAEISDGRDSWIITDVIGEGKFKAITKTSAENLYKDIRDSATTPTHDELIAFLEDSTEELPSWLETFDISGKTDTNNPIYKFYEEDVQKYLRRIRPDMRRITDENDVDWFKVEVTREDAQKPVLAFERTYPTVTGRASSFAEARSVLEEYKKRFKLSFDTDFADVIFTGEYDKFGKKQRARAVTYNNKITLTENVTKTTADHEFVHLVFNNLDKINAFSDFSKDDLLLAVNGGEQYSVEQSEELQEKLAVGFEEYVRGRRENMANLLSRFYQKLVDLLKGFFESFRTQTDVVSEFYNRLATGEGKEIVVFIGNSQNDVRRFLRTGEIVEDFGLLEGQAERGQERREFFERLVETVDIDDHSRNLLRKDINTLENITAQARDIYLKDPNEFAVARTFEKEADLRRMKKARLDTKFSQMLEPYMKLKKNSLEKVTEVLMKGDEKAKDYNENELREMNLNAEEVVAYKAVRQAFNVAHEYLIAEMARNGMPAEEVEEFRRTRIGYMPHKWEFRYAVKTQKLDPKTDRWETVEMETFKSERLARVAWEKMRTENSDSNTRFTLDTLDNLEVDFFSEQRLSFEAMKSAISQAKTGNDIRDQMVDALRNMMKEKGFGRNYMRRTGVRGYQRKEAPEIIANYFAGMNGYITKMEAGKRYYDALSTIDARRQAKFYAWMRDMIAYDMGNSREFERIKAVGFIYYLANDLSFLLTNTTQNLIIGMGELSKYMTGAQKIAKPEAMILKATKDWATQNITPEEKATIDGLLALGQIGGEMTSELMGFKNNPLYAEISSKVSKALYSSTAFVETHINRVPAFLAARRLFIEQGMTAKQANEKALDVSNDIHFRYGRQNRPRFERGVGGAFFIFNHYLRSFLYQLSRDLSRGEYLAFARKMVYTTALGGTTSLPFARLLSMIFKKIFHDDDDEEGESEMSKLYIAITRGIPASLVGIDLSGRVGVDILSINSVFEDSGDVKSYIGALGNLFFINTGADGASEGGRFQKAVELVRQGRLIDSAGYALPDMFANLFKAYAGYTYGVRSFAGTPLENADGEVYKYNAWEALIKATGFTPTQESLLWDAKSEEWAETDRVSAERSRLRRTIQGQIQRGEIEEARQTQREAIEAGTLGDDTDYIRQFASGRFMQDALDSWASAEKNSSTLSKIEDKLVEEIYGADVTDTQKNNTRKDFAVYRSYGLNDPTISAYMSASNNGEKVGVLLSAREEMGEEVFKEFYTKGRKEISLESGNKSPILISDEVDESYRKARNIKLNPETVEEQKPFQDKEEVSDRGFIKQVMVYAEALGTDPVTAFNRILTGQRIRRVDNGTIIVERIPVGESQNIKEETGINMELTKLDHTIPLQLGGSNDQKNLKLVTTADHTRYTRVENLLGKLLRDGKITKEVAQEVIVKYKNGEVDDEYVNNLK